LLYSWFQAENRPSGGVLPNPELVFRGTLGVLVAIAAGRLLQVGLPARPRPRYVPHDIAFPALDDDTFHDWSSFPSDHAVLVGAIVTAVWAKSRPLGLLAAACGALFVCLPRIYFGLHYVSDVLGGAALGAALMWAVLRMPLPTSAWDWLRRLDARAPALVVLGLFVLGWEMIELFETARRLVPAAAKAAGIMGGNAG